MLSIFCDLKSRWWAKSANLYYKWALNFCINDLTLLWSIFVVDWVTWEKYQKIKAHSWNRLSFKQSGQISFMTEKKDSCLWKIVCLGIELLWKKWWENLSHIVIFNESGSNFFMIFDHDLRYFKSSRKIWRLDINWLTKIRLFWIVDLTDKSVIKENSFSEFIDVQRKS